MDIKSIREIIGILMESSNYFRLTLKERKELISYILTLSINLELIKLN